MARRAKIIEDRPTSRRVGALGALWPFVRPYRGQLAVALAALVLTSAISLVLPLAVRRVVDNFDDGAGLLDQYFGAALAIVALLALGTAARYFFVTRLGERVVADLRKA
ncbi:MAG: ABC transporter, partial [Paracoccus sp.]|nr:ABC transporter [Paracoccus sp. (in: a-proteobacteria)]